MIAISHRPTVLAERPEDCLCEGEWPASDKEVIFDGERTRFESGDVSGSSSSPSESPVGRLRLHRDFWLSTMDATKLFCSITLSIISYGYQLPWNSLGPATAAQQPNHPSALEDRQFVTETVKKGWSWAPGSGPRAASLGASCLLE